MLLAAREAEAEGRRVAIAYVETHKRPETEALVHGFTVIPRWQLAYRGVTLEEMDLDAVLGEHPDLAVVDELAHTNAPGCRHARRYQDAQELLEAGIDVYTTLNVQHIESLNDIVAQITGITVRETVPDQILEEADEVGLVDLPPDELIQRLHEGKVYVPEQAQRAIDKFFRPGNLTALREIALRYLAGQVDHQMRAYMEAHAIAGPWPAGERVLVCIDADPLAERLVRTGRRMAAGLDAEWIVLHVETPEYATLPEAARDRIARTLRLAEELGARTVSVPGTRASEEIIRYAKAQNVSKILVGVSHHPRWIQLIHGSVVDRIVRAAGDIDVYVISSAAEHTRTPDAPGERPVLYGKAYLYGAAVMAFGVLVGALVHGVWAQANLTMLFLLAVVIVAVQWGRGPATLAAAISLAAFAFFFGPPSFTYTVADSQYLVTVAALLVVGLVIGTLASRTREQAQAARSREAYMAALHALSGELAATNDLDAILGQVSRHIAATFCRSVAIFLPKSDTLEPRLATPGFPLTENERAVADWAFRHGHAAGYATDTLPAAAARYMPLKTAQRVVGVLGVQPPALGPRLTPEQRRLLDAFASQAALAIERVELAEEARRGDIARETERLQTALLNSISHDLRTPLASITGALTSLADRSAPVDDAVRRELLQNAKEEADRLNHLVGSLLDMNRLEAGTLRLRVEPGDVEDLIGAALAQLGETAQHRDIRVRLEPHLPPVPMDFALVTQALVNILDNAMRYSPPDAPIEIEARLAGDEVQIRVEDRGLGIPPGDVTRIFDKFYRVQHDGAGHGAGLGLAISHGIVDAHGGRIWAANRRDGGAVVAFALPVRLPQPAEQGDRASGWATPGRAS